MGLHWLPEEEQRFFLQDSTPARRQWIPEFLNSIRAASASVAVAASPSVAVLQPVKTDGDPVVPSNPERKQKKLWADISTTVSNMGERYGRLLNNILLFCAVFMLLGVARSITPHFQTSNTEVASLPGHLQNVANIMPSYPQAQPLGLFASSLTQPQPDHFQNPQAQAVGMLVQPFPMQVGMGPGDTTGILQPSAQTVRSASCAPNTFGLTSMILSYQHPNNVKPIWKALSEDGKPLAQRVGRHQVIVLEDGGGRARQNWRSAMNLPDEQINPGSRVAGDVLLELNNLHEIRAYREGIQRAVGDVVCLLQDDDIPPPDGAWIRNILEMFENDPALGIVGCNHGWGLTYGQGKIYGEPIGKGKNLRNSYKINYRHPCVKDLEARFQYVVATDIGPQCYRRSAYEKSEGWDLRYSKPGEPGIGFDHEMSYKFARLGFSTGITECGFLERRRGGQASTSTPHKKAIRMHNLEHNMKRITKEYGQEYQKLSEEATARNDNTLVKVQKGKKN